MTRRRPGAALETPNVKLHPVAAAARLAALVSLALAAGCSSLDAGLSGDVIDYRSGATKAKPLDVPPDLSQLSRESRYQRAGGVVSAAAAAVAPATGGATAPAVALTALDDMRVERDGQQRWLVLKATPEQLWPQLQAFWTQRGFTLEVEDAKAGVIETSWAENRAKLPQDVVRNTLGKLIGNAWDTGERDQFRMRVERTATGSEVYIAHRGIEEVYTSPLKEATTWRARASDPQLEAEMLSRLMVALGAKEEPARKLVASAPESTPRARTVDGGAAIEIDDPFDRAWRRVGLALDRGGFTVEDRDRSLGLYYVRYVDPKSVGKEEPGFWSRLMGDKTNSLAAVRYRIAVKGNGDKSVLAVLTSAGGADVGENGQRITALLVNELR